jgi:hypothetical protein
MPGPDLKRVRITRDLVLFTAGLVILLHQTFLVPQAQPAVIAAATAIVLSPLVIRVDNARKDQAREVKNGLD